MKTWICVRGIGTTPHEHQVFKAWCEQRPKSNIVGYNYPYLDNRRALVSQPGLNPSSDKLEETLCGYAADKAIEGIVCDHPLIAAMAVRCGLPVGTFGPKGFRAIWPV